jgi:sec-independent protein translocase protein TatA
MGFLREPSHILIILLVVVVLFGSRRLPDAAKGLGRSLRIFKSEIKEMQKDDEKDRPAAEPIEGRVIDPADADRAARERIRDTRSDA